MNQPLESRVSRLEGVIEQILVRLDSIERRLDSLENRMEIRFNQIDTKFNWLIGIVVVTWTTAILAILFHK